MNTPSNTNNSQTELNATKVLNVEIPERVYWHIRRCATESRMSMKEFMANFCQAAKPLPAEPGANTGNSEGFKSKAEDA